ncbi:MAG: glycosyltransferase family 39 protein [Planctomycetes bacterium]|nr:glycosyltransferase family 39 protein [Planctomycetota bacterium]
MHTRRASWDDWLARAGRETWIGAAVLALACALRVLHVLDMRASPLFSAPQMDALYHVEWARAVAAGVEFRPGPFFRAPLYPWFLGLQLELFGDGLLVPRLVQCALGTLTVFFVWRAARLVFDRATGLLAALLVATHWTSIFYDGQLLLEALCTPLYAAALWCTLRFDRRPGAALGLLSGVLWGLGTITRPNVLPLAPLLGLWSLARHRKSVGLRAPLFLCLGWIAPILPLTAYNALVGHDRVLISSQAGVNLWIGNNPSSDGTSAIVPGTREDWWGGFYDAIALAEREAGRPLRASEVSAHYAHKALAFARAQPTQWLKLTAHKLRLLWLDWELANNEEPRFLMLRYSPWMRALPARFGWLLAAAVVGLLGARGLVGRIFPVLAFTAVFAGSIVLFFVNARFRIPLVPPLAMLASLGILTCLDALLERRVVLALGLAAAGALSAAVSFTPPQGLEQRSSSNGHLEIGAGELRAREFDKACASFERALEFDAGNIVARRGLAEAAYFAGQSERAEREYRRVLTQAPADAFAWEGLGRVLFKRGDTAQACEAFQRATGASPAFFEAWYSLGIAQAERQDFLAALEAFEHALPLEPLLAGDYRLDAHRRAAASALALGRNERAAEVARIGLERWPADEFLRGVVNGR